MSRRSTVKKKSTKEKEKPQEEVGENDDRNLVVVDDDFEEADFEERVWLFWRSNKNNVYLALIIALASLAGYQGMVYMQAKERKAVGDAYLESRNADPIAFINEHASSTLAGVALVSLGDEKYQAKDFAAAAGHYKDAVKTLANTPLGPRARIGHGLSSLQSGDIATGRSALTVVADNAEILTIHRAEAMYHLGVLETGEKNFEEARGWFKDLEDLKSAGFWSQKVQLLKRSISELNEEAPEVLESPVSPENADATATEPEKVAE